MERFASPGTLSSHSSHDPQAAAPRGVKPDAEAHRWRILAVDDDRGALSTFDRVLSRAGHAVTCCGDLPSARAALSQGSYDLVLTDLFLGDQTLGYEIAETARARRPPIPVVLITGHPSIDNAHEAIRSRVWRIVTKPVDPKTLTSVCIRAIEEWRIRRRTEALEAQVRILSEILPRCIEANDPMTAGHSERVVGYAEALARHCRLDEADMESLRLASLLHDIGKIGIPERILSKRGPLDASERDIIKQHPRLGFEILEPLRGQDKARLWVYQHHERWDGKGYPEGLAGEDVELGGRILILAEVYDALRSARSYKEGWEVPRIAEFFRQQAGTQFDPALSHLVADGLERRGSSFLANQPAALF